jgi:hypothetical protein
MAKVKDSPVIDTHELVTQRHEERMYGHYNLTPYWGNGFHLGGYGGWNAGMSETHYAAAIRRQDEPSVERHRRNDLHLRSIATVTDYNLQATTHGSIGHIEGLQIDGTDWTIHFLTMDTKNWWPGKDVLISPCSADAST